MSNFMFVWRRLAILCLTATMCGGGCDQGSVLRLEQEYAKAPPYSERPNIVLITLEDLSPRIRSFGDIVAFTPNIDALSLQGIRFRQVFTTAGVCAPSRSSLITGVHQQFLGTQNMRTATFDQVPGGFTYDSVPPAQVKAFPEILRKHGYFTLNNAKTDYQFGDPFTVWDSNGARASWKNVPDGQPFFMMVNFNNTHESRTWGVDGERNAHPLAAAARARNAKLDAKKTHFTDSSKVVVPPYYPDTQIVRKNIARHYDNISYEDQRIGQLIKDLEVAGLLERTIVFLTTDHGDGLPRAKRTLYDTGIHVPMIVRFPDGMGAGTQIDELISFVDIAPTILSLAGIDVPNYVQGRVFVGPKKQAAPKQIYAASDRLDDAPGRKRAVRTHDFKYIRNYMPALPRVPELKYSSVNPISQEIKKGLERNTLSSLQKQYFIGPSPEEELYDLANDPHELVNLIDRETYSNVKEKMRELENAWGETGKDYSKVSEIDMALDMWPGGQQPITSVPVACRLHDGVIRLASRTPGASIGFKNSDDAARDWQLFSNSVTSQKITAKAIRYGYKESSIVEFSLSEMSPCHD